MLPEIIATDVHCRISDFDICNPHPLVQNLDNPIFQIFDFLIIFLFMEDPGGILRRFLGYRSTLTWQGLGVYSSIVALVFFLVTLLLSSGLQNPRQPNHRMQTCCRDSVEDLLLHFLLF